MWQLRAPGNHGVTGGFDLPGSEPGEEGTKLGRSGGTLTLPGTWNQDGGPGPSRSKGPGNEPLCARAGLVTFS
jgi:hypothetical protein